MPPITATDPLTAIKNIVDNNSLVIFSKTTCGFCKQAKALFTSLNVPYHVEELDKISNGNVIQEALASETGHRTVPSVWLNGKFIGGSAEVHQLNEEGNLEPLLQGLRSSAPSEMSSRTYDFDLIVIGGGSGGLAASKEAALLGKKVALLDFVQPTPLGTSWGLGGTCVNVGCIPKKLMHQAALLKEGMHDAPSFGWKFSAGVEMNWGELVENVQNHIASLNWGYRVALREKKVQYINAHGTLIDANTVKLRLGGRRPAGSTPHEQNSEVVIAPKRRRLCACPPLIRHLIRSPAWSRGGGREEAGRGTTTTGDTLTTVDKKNREKVITGETILLATGLRPRYLDIPGDRELCITSDDLFSLSYPPGKTLCVGASYVSLECAGFLKAFGFDVTVMVRSILLRGFDQQMANLVGDYMEKQAGIRFLKECIPVKIEKVAEGTPPTLKVTAKFSDGREFVETFNTVVVAIGRDACTKNIGLENVGVKLNPKNGKVICDDTERSSVPNIYAIGDILDGKLELTPVAIHAGRALARRLYGFSSVKTDYVNVPTTVFTPLEYGCVGYAEEDALEKFGADNVEVYHSYFTPLEWSVPKRGDNLCYAKLIVTGPEEKVIGFHYLGPNAGEVTQGFGIAFKLNAKKADFDNLIGIHPTQAEAAALKSFAKPGHPTEALWTNIWEPMSRDELCVHTKKIEQVEFWIEQHLRPKEEGGHPAFLLLTGPSGSAKTTTLRVLCREKGISLIEWDNPNSSDQAFGDSDRFDWNESQSQSFQLQDFLLRVSRFNPLAVTFSDAVESSLPRSNEIINRSIILLEEFPNSLYRNPKELHDILRLYKRRGRHPLVCIVSDSVIHSLSISSLIPLQLQAQLGFTVITFKAVAPTILRKTLRRIAQGQRVSITDDQLEEIVASTGGDLRASVNALQFRHATESRSQNGKKKDGAVEVKDQSLFIFRALGKVVYAKRLPNKDVAVDQSLPVHMKRNGLAREFPLKEKPEEILEKLPITGDLFQLYVQENYPQFVSCAEDLAVGADYLSTADALRMDRHYKELGDLPTDLAIRGILFANREPVANGFKPFRKVGWLETQRQMNQRTKALRSALVSAGLYSWNGWEEVGIAVHCGNFISAIPQQLLIQLTKFKESLFRPALTETDTAEDETNEVDGAVTLCSPMEEGDDVEPSQSNSTEEDVVIEEYDDE
ncbi:unnamed protein product [Cyprideis torosa]|uniref:Thioredoxin reductase n=1 Tax=Cyprideis torosa TaxID=163714 RepID=A0A7R8W7B3_9CRUS|nr:unnamed protein product [Cyprideis torosa]CAG0886112.1 unnamed protein product [Cyprideis torosa]